MKLDEEEMTNCYRVGYGTPEGNDLAVLQHEKKYSDEELEDRIFQAVSLVLEEKMKEEDEYRVRSYENIHFEVIEKLKEEFGFKSVEYTAKWKIFGWPNILNEKSWEGQRTEKLDRLTDFLKSDGFFMKKDGILRKIHEDDNESDI